MGDIYISSDQHWGHGNINRHCNRGFDNIHDMNQFMTDQINKVVKQNDHLYLLGDVSYRGSPVRDYLKTLNCNNIYISIGNHDRAKDLYELQKTYGKVKLVDKYIEINHRGQWIFMMHYPMRSWAKSFHGSWHLFGHVHGNLDREDRILKRKTLDVGVDNCVNYGKIFGEPWSFDEIKAVMETRTGEMSV
jgi:calcineurin-like phosphoesterase family protein